MNLKVLGSSSKGNCYILTNENEALIIEAGIPLLEVKKALSFDVRKIVGVVVSHSHGDHAIYVEQYRKVGISVFDAYRLCEINNGKFGKFVMGNFIIDTFPLIHDVPCYGYLIAHPEMGKLLFATDTEYVKYRFKNLNHILIEANYDKKYLLKSDAKRKHVLEGHMSIDTAERFINANKTGLLQNVVLLHLSSDGSNPKEFKNRIQNITNADVNIATKGLEINLDLVPF